MKHGTATALLIVGAVFAPATTARANVYSTYTSASDYRWRVTYMPDFDQRRSFCVDRPPLPSDGAMYCVPTATINVAAYVASRGYPFVNPGSNTWGVSGTTRYNAITGNILTLGNIMSTNPISGTTSVGAHVGTLGWFPPTHFVVTRKYPEGYYAPTINTIGHGGVNGSLSVIAWGSYEYVGTTLLTRKSGHAVTPIDVKVNDSGSATLGYRDPADSPADCGQSGWVQKLSSVTRVVVSRGGYQRIMSQLAISDTRRRIIDSVMLIRPRFGLWNSDPSLRGVTDTLVMHTPQMTQPNPGPQTKSYTAPAGAITDFDTATDWLHHYVLTTIPGSSLVRRLWRVDAISGEWEQMGDIVRAIRVKVGRKREVYVLSTTSVTVYDFDADPPIVTPVTLPLGVVGTNMALDDDTDEVIVYENANKRFHIYTEGMGAFVETYDFPGFINVDGAISMGPGCDGSILFASEGVNSIYRFGRDPDTGDFTLRGSVSNVHTVAPSNVAYDDQCNLVFTSNGVVQELELIEDRIGQIWVPVQDSLFAGVTSISDRLLIGRGRTNYDPAEHDGPEWDNIHPDDLEFDPIAPPCPGDVNADDVVNFEDFSIVLAEYGQEETWLAADLNQDGVVDFADFSEVLANYGVVCD